MRHLRPLIDLTPVDGSCFTGARAVCACALAMMLFVVSGPVNGYAQAPNWAVDASEYEYTLTATVAVEIDATPAADSGDVLGAFAGGTVRGTARPDMSAGPDGLYFLTVYGNKEGQPISFRVYDASENTVRVAARTLSFQPDATYGALASPFRVAIGTAELPGVESWSVSPAAYEQTMTVTATVVAESEGRSSSGPADRVAAFVNGEVRGVAEAEPVGDENVFFLTVYGDPPDANRTLTLRYYDAATDRVYPTENTALSFQSNAVKGTPGSPVEVLATRPAAEVEGSLDLGDVAPHPLDRETLVRFAADRNVRVRLVLYDVAGRRVRLLYEGRLEKNQTYRRWLRVEGLASGVYFLRLRGARDVEVQRVAVVR